MSDELEEVCEWCGCEALGHDARSRVAHLEGALREILDSNGGFTAAWYDEWAHNASRALTASPTMTPATYGAGVTSLATSHGAAFAPTMTVDPKEASA